MSNDTLTIGSVPGLEPEEQPVTREVDLPITVKGNLTGTALGALSGQAQITESAHEFASNLKKICSNCKHFDKTAAQKVFAEHAETPEGRAELVNLGSSILQMDPTGDLSEHMAHLGKCHAFSEIRGVDVIVHPLGHCPDTSFGFGDLFKPIDKAAEVRGAKGYDQIMQQASGKIIL